jgi:hypothetical protein
LRNVRSCKSILGRVLLSKYFYSWRSREAPGARARRIDRAKAAMNEFVEAVSLLEPSTSRIDAEVSFDEFSLDIDMRYDGEPMEFPSARPADSDLLENERAVAKLAGFLIRNYVERVKSDRINGRCRVQFHLEH